MAKTPPKPQPGKHKSAVGVKIGVNKTGAQRAVAKVKSVRAEKVRGVVKAPKKFTKLGEAKPLPVPLGRAQIRREGEMEVRRERVTEMILQCMTMRQMIAQLAEEGIINSETGGPWSIETIHNDIQIAKQVWRAGTLRNMEEIKDRELHKIDLMEKEAWGGWYRSKELRQLQIKETREGKKSTVSKVPGFHDGDTKFLTLILTCHQRRSEVLGLSAPKKTELTGKNGAPLALVSQDLSKASTEDLRQLEALLVKLGGENASPDNSAT